MSSLMLYSHFSGEVFRRFREDNTLVQVHRKSNSFAQAHREGDRFVQVQIQMSPSEFNLSSVLSDLGVLILPLVGAVGNKYRTSARFFLQKLLHGEYETKT